MQNKADNNSNNQSIKTAIYLHLTFIPTLYDQCNVNQKYALLRQVFKFGLTYFEGSYRSHWLNPALSHNYLKIKEKGLLIIEQPAENVGNIPLVPGMCLQLNTFTHFLPLLLT